MLMVKLNILGGWEVDHIKPISEGGTNKLNNLRPLNIPANRGRNN